MRMLITSIAAIFLIPGVIFAETVSSTATPAIVDKNSNGVYDLKETQAGFPNVTQADMDKADADGDGKVTAAEMQKAIADGVFK